MSPATDPKDFLPKNEPKETINVVKTRSSDTLKNFIALEIY